MHPRCPKCGVIQTPPIHFFGEENEFALYWCECDTIFTVLTYTTTKVISFWEMRLTIPDTVKPVRPDLVEPINTCPRCGERKVDKLTWNYDGTIITCRNCSCSYELDTEHRRVL